MKDNKDNEDIFNIPNLLTFSRVILTFVIVYMIFAEFEIIPIISVFVIAALTDFFDGQIARRFNLKTEFGRKFDIRADRFLWGGTVIAFLISYSISGILLNYHILQLFLIMSRELISLPFFFIGLKSKKGVVEARFIGKFTTLLQGFALPSLMLSIFYEAFSYSIYLSILTGIVGAISAGYFIRDIRYQEVKNERKR